jgi:hypothetical protein
MSSCMVVPRRLQIVDSLLDLQAHTEEPDAIRLRRAHLAKYAKAAFAGALVICLAAAARVGASALVGESNENAQASAQSLSVSDAPTWAEPMATRGAPLLAMSAIDTTSKSIAAAKSAKKKRR